ncbi:hypothetical protein VB834_29155 [Limnoraphis robusta Tam1]|uniref:hypothetical protein n=1 Tax=Limnoraphis robusta TaxID=1118279 RepID=UPI002B202122|nr:hypothetical protein [Limnoraphis robusta]MEA5495983.1 hypothetical protein [Limnoraphis robusta BA-68 BA1]MEA5543104.1 hypothetical protein [Limnoraphis robusta Tam1]MEA5548465.1 hypothetical protein [Limnoraphis robusta CCNP1324]
MHAHFDTGDLAIATTGETFAYDSRPESRHERHMNLKRTLQKVIFKHSYNQVSLMTVPKYNIERNNSKFTTE